jgi:hypothetical protein
MKKSFVFVVALALAVAARSQQPAILLEEWSKQPVLHVLDTQYRKESAVILLDKRRMEFVDEGKSVSLYRTLHRIVRVNDDNGIESFNRIYLGVSDNKDIVDIRARTILPGGKVIEIDKQNIKDLKEEDGNMYKIFAMEGLEKGCEIEYYYTFKRNTSFFGREMLQGNFPVLDARLEVFGPERLVFQLKGFNCAPEVTDTLFGGKRRFTTGLRNIPGAEKEKYAAYNANLQKVEYKLSYNTTTSNGHERLFTWNELAKRLHSIYATFTEKDLDKAGDLVRSNGWDKLTGDKEKIVAVENFLKKQFTTREDIDEEKAGNIEWILKNRIASHQGIIRLYGALYQKLGVDWQMVLACDREECSIDRSFENWNTPSNFLIYFPTVKKYLAPTLLTMRYPYIDPYWGAGDALYCKTTTIGNFTTAIAEVRSVPLEDYTQTFNKIEATLRLDKGMDTVLIDIKHSFGGYSGATYRAGYTLSNPEEQRTFLKEIIRSCTNSENIVSSNLQNTDFESNNDNKPFTVQASVKSGELLEKAGNKILVKIGTIIGPQTQMYQEKPRQFPMVVAYPHTFERWIDFVVPEGYMVKNPGDLGIKYDYDEGGVVTLGFASEYKMEGNVLKIHVLEQYLKTFYPLTDYVKFEKVINAAADFNKVVLVLEKK